MMRILLFFAPFLLVAQPRIGSIEVFGAVRVPKEKIVKAVGVKVGDRLPQSKGAAEEKVEDVDGVVKARIEGFCCVERQAILYVGVQERGAPGFEYRAEPTGEPALPPEVVAVYREFTQAVNRAASQGDVEEDFSQGHSLMRNVVCRTVQERMVGLAELHESGLRRALRESGDPEERLVAAYVLAYAPDKAKVVDDLQLGLRDPEDGVRQNAARALKGIAVLGQRDAGAGIRVQPTWFVEMLNSLALGDRLEGASTLLWFTDKPNPGVIASIRERALPALTEMAEWRHLPHALPAYLLLGRVWGKTDQEMQDAWSRGERDQTVRSLRKGPK